MTPYIWKCAASTCEVPYTGSRDGIFFKSALTAFCDEVLQDFEDELFDTTNGTNFSTYVDRMNSVYESNGCTPHQFCSKNTFTDSMFAWWANKNIDFREHIDPYCQYEPKVLACDGTHIGPALRTVTMQPIETGDSYYVKTVTVKRLESCCFSLLPADRVFLFAIENWGHYCLGVILTILVTSIISRKMVFHFNLAFKIALYLSRLVWFVKLHFSNKF